MSASPPPSPHSPLPLRPGPLGPDTVAKPGRNEVAVRVRPAPVPSPAPAPATPPPPVLTPQRTPPPPVRRHGPDFRHARCQMGCCHGVGGGRRGEGVSWAGQRCAYQFFFVKHPSASGVSPLHCLEKIHLGRCFGSRRGSDTTQTKRNNQCIHGIDR